ncbi:MAG TPA: hypothetical protein VHC95_05495 [Opitutales bacterium]|nr:hypothetical protein [Opitutales bacterium]
MSDPENPPLCASEPADTLDNDLDLTARPEPASPPPRPVNPLFGSIKQYQPAPRLPEYNHVESVTGATVADPARLRLRPAKFENEPDWAAPLNWFTRPMEEFGTSLMVYWFGYGVLQSLLVMLTSAFVPGYSSGPVLGLTVIFGPVFGWFMDVLMMVSSGLGFCAGVVFLIAEPVLFFMFFFSVEWRTRCRYFGIMVGVLILRAVIFTFALSR